MQAMANRLPQIPNSEFQARYSFNTTYEAEGMISSHPRMQYYNGIETMRNSFSVHTHAKEGSELSYASSPRTVNGFKILVHRLGNETEVGTDDSIIEYMVISVESMDKKQVRTLHDRIVDTLQAECQQGRKLKDLSMVAPVALGWGAQHEVALQVIHPLNRHQRT